MRTLPHLSRVQRQNGVYRVIAGKYIIEVVLEEDDDSYHGVLTDFEKDLNRAVREIHRVLVYKIVDEDTGISYYGPHAMKFTVRVKDVEDS